MIKIKHRNTGAVLHTVDAETLRRAVLEGVDLAGADLGCADLAGANLRCANLRHADLRRAYLRGAYLEGVDLGGANLRGADLGGANFRSAALEKADLRRADLGFADLQSAYLGGADLQGAYLRGADFQGAYLGSAYLGEQWIIQGPTRSDGHYFILTNFKDEGVRVKAGCRNFTLARAREHWNQTRGNTPLGLETFAILDFMETTARIRGLKLD